MANITLKYEDLLRRTAKNLTELLRPELEADARVVQKGLLLYRQGLVSLRKLENDSLFGIVQDVTPVNVKVNMAELERSKCSCPTVGLCRHQLAVFFYVYAEVGSVSDWVDAWRKPMKEKSAVEQLGLQRAKDLMKTSERVKPSYESWVSMFEDSFGSIMKVQEKVRPYVIPELFQVYIRKLKVGAPIDKEWALLYELVYTVDAFNRLLKLSAEQGFSREEIQRYYLHIVHNLMDDAEDAVERLMVHSLPFAFDEFMQGLIGQSKSLLGGESALEYERIQMYRMLWTELFRNSTWREPERERLDELVRRDGYFSNEVALIHQLVLARKDEDALTRLSKLEAADLPYMVYWLEYLGAYGEWKRMGVYVERFVNGLKAYLLQLRDYHACSRFVYLATKTVASFCKEQGRPDLYERTLVQTLPYSYGDYEVLLFDTGQYEKWGELQALIDYQFHYLPKDKLKVIEKSKPEVLIPIYHQVAQWHIDAKSRGNYKEAVRLLKKLRTVYKKLKRVDEWEVFLALLVERTRRLRAFQEECRKGKLIEG